MKNKLILVIFAILSLVLITGCGSKNNVRVEIMNSLTGTWEYQINKGYKSIKGIKSTYTFDKNYTFTFKNATILSNGNEMTLTDLSGTYELNMEDKKIILTFNNKEDSDGLTKELTYKYEEGKFYLNPDSEGNETYKKIK